MLKFLIRLKEFLFHFLVLCNVGQCNYFPNDTLIIVAHRANRNKIC